MAGDGPGQGRLSSPRGPHLSGSGPGPAAETIVPTAQTSASVAGAPIIWIPVGGDGRHRMLEWSRTPLTYAQLGMGHLSLPISGLTWAQAREAAASVGGRLAASAEWEWMAAGPDGRRYPWGDHDWTPVRANLRGSGHGTVLPTGSWPAGATPDGVEDVAGNVWEWTATETSAGHGRALRGGSYQSLIRYATCAYVNEAPPDLRSAGIGVRVVREP